MPKSVDKLTRKALLLRFGTLAEGLGLEATREQAEAVEHAEAMNERWKEQKKAANRRWRLRNIEACRERCRQWYRAHPDTRTYQDRKEGYTRYRMAHHEELKAKARARYAAHREEEAAKARERREANREAYNAHMREYHAGRREIINARQRADRKANPEKYRAYEAKRDKEKRNAQARARRAAKKAEQESKTP